MDISRNFFRRSKLPFPGLRPRGERDCGVKKALEEGKICQGRYENYLQIYQELKDKKKY